MRCCFCISVVIADRTPLAGGNSLYCRKPFKTLQKFHTEQGIFTTALMIDCCKYQDQVR